MIAAPADLASFGLTDFVREQIETATSSEGRRYWLRQAAEQLRSLGRHADANKLGVAAVMADPASPSGPGPSREGSAGCESGSIASGGTKTFCSCDRCF